MRSSRLVLAPALAVAGLATVACSSNGITPVRTAFNKAVYEQSLGNHAAARQLYTRALDEDPSDYRARFNLGLVYEELAERSDDPATASDLRERARSAYERVLADRPDNLRARVNLAGLIGDEGDEATARRMLRDAIAEHPDAALPRAALAARLLADRRAPAPGTPDADEAVADGDDSGPVAAGRLAEIEALLRAALDAEPRDPMASDLLASVLAARGAFEEARGLIDRAADSDPSDLGALRRAVELELAAGHPREAAVLAERLLLIAPEHRAGHLLAAEAARALDRPRDELRHLWAADALAPQPADPPPPPPGSIAARLRQLYRALAERAGAADEEAGGPARLDSRPVPD